MSKDNVFKHVLLITLISISIQCFQPFTTQQRLNCKLTDISSFIAILARQTGSCEVRHVAPSD